MVKKDRLGESGNSCALAGEGRSGDPIAEVVAKDSRRILSGSFRGRPLPPIPFLPAGAALVLISFQPGSNFYNDPCLKAQRRTGCFHAGAKLTGGGATA